MGFQTKSELYCHLRLAIALKQFQLKQVLMQCDSYIGNNSIVQKCLSTSSRAINVKEFTGGVIVWGLYYWYNFIKQNLLPIIQQLIIIYKIHLILIRMKKLRVGFDHWIIIWWQLKSFPYLILLCQCNIIGKNMCTNSRLIFYCNSYFRDRKLKCKIFHHNLKERYEKLLRFFERQYNEEAGLQIHLISVKDNNWLMLLASCFSILYHQRAVLLL